MREYRVTYQNRDHVLRTDYIQQQNRTKALAEWVERNPAARVLSIEYVHNQSKRWIF